MPTREKVPAPAANSVTPVSISRRALFIAVATIVLATIAAYLNSFHGAFVFDDRETILENDTLRSLSASFSPPKNSGLTVSGRPIVNFTLAINRLFGGNHPWGYHLFNLVIHLAAALALFGVIRRSFLQPALRERFAQASLPLACAAAILWAVHPLQTESVTYIVQRAEALVGLFYLLTLYGCIRSLDSPKTHEWAIFAWIVCLFGMASKEVMVSGPLIIVLYDRAFVFSSLREGWIKRRNLYLSLAATWIFLGWLVVGTNGRGATTGFASGTTWISYTLTQFHAIALYLKLVFWPSPLVFDYGTGVAKNFGEVAPYAFLTLALIVGILIAWRRSPVVGFLGTFVLAVLAPTTSVVPVATQTIAEHRMYLPLAAFIALAVSGLYLALDRKSFFVCGVWACVLTALTVRRNEDYRTEIGLWEDTVEKRPNENARAHFNLALLLAREKRSDEAIQHYRAATRIKPDYFDAQTNLGSALVKAGQASEALAPLSAAVQINPGAAEPRANLGSALYSLGRLPEAKQAYDEAVRLKPNDAGIHDGLGLVFAGLRQVSEALQQWEEAIRLNPRDDEAQTKLAIALCQLGRFEEAVPHFAAVVQMKPDDAQAENNLGNAFLALGRTEDALQHYTAAIKVAPHSFEARYNLGNALSQAKQWTGAIESYRTALLIRPDSADAHINCAAALLQAGRTAEALRDYEAAAQIEPANAQLRETVTQLRAQTFLPTAPK